MNARPRSARVTAQAKVNLFLHVLAREKSGYHQLETAFCRLALADDVVVHTQPARMGGIRTIDCRGADVGPAGRNLAFRAAVAYADARGWPAGFRIEIDKRIPVGGGLGGGSADAGAVLRALATLDPKPPTRDELLALALSLGADVPFLTLRSPLALAWGRGERILPLPPLPERPVVLATMPFGVPTADAYAWLASTRSSSQPIPRVLPLNAFREWEAFASLASNDFEKVVIDRHPEIGESIGFLSSAKGVALTRMSGSGATVFAILADGTAPWSVAKDLPAPATAITTATALKVAPVQIIDS
ncbi:MAG TPA: 4-(cytidine 5'-diphospho)-2-C-methyl-D-erythritol kinase [Gemmatimonadaceae bacterium]|nr:4-(cytidine 5'-diphospho)-2-C-methyl-D-erythritol kinase [Gemmatimonadaceae bacterium]